jgi:hypothetical protein
MLARFAAGWGGKVSSVRGFSFVGRRRQCQNYLMRRYAILDVALGLIFVGLAVLVGWGAYYSSFSDLTICPAGLPCDFSALLHASVGTPIGAALR